MRDVELAIEISSRASTAGMDATVAAAKEMRSEVQSAATAAAGGLDRVGTAADDLDGKAGRATGALGALSSGFELVGAEKYAGALQAAAMATDFASGAGQALTLILELESVSRIRAGVAAGAQAVATTAASAATKAAAIAQWALNAALAANPVGLIIIAIIALVAAFVLAYKKCETFRDIVQAAMKIATFQIRLVVGVVSDLVGWVVDRAVPMWAVLRDAVATALGVVRDKFAPVLEVAQQVFGKIKDTIATAIDLAKDKIEFFREKAVAAFDAMMTPINAVKDAIGWIIDKLAQIKIPDLPFGIGGSSADLPVVTRPGVTTPDQAPVVININTTVDPLTDPNATTAAIVSAVSSHLTQFGRQVVVA